MEILIATHNLAKLARYKKIIQEITGVKIFSLADLGITEKVEEIFATNIENARHKAQIYGKLSGKITLAVDEAVMTNFLPEHEQPGVYVRRFCGNKEELTDREVIETWRKIFRKYPQEDKQFIWSFALAYFDPQKNTRGDFLVEQISYVARVFSQNEKTDGYPMSAILSPHRNGRAYLDMTSEMQEEIDRKRFQSFLEVFREWLEAT